MHARRAIARFVGTAGDLVDEHPEPGAWSEAQFRSHIVQCPDCKRVYRETLTAAARIGHELRAERAEHLRELRRKNFRARAIDATAGGKRRGRWGLRLALIPALFAMLLLVFRAQGGEDGLVARWSGGEVRAAGQLLSADRPLMRLSPGDWCHTRGNAVATLAARVDPAPEGEAEPFELGVETDVLILDPRARAVRLERGTLEATGPARIVTPIGILDLAEGASARIGVDAGGTDVECSEGSSTWTGPTGSRDLSAGESARFVAG